MNLLTFYLELVRFWPRSTPEITYDCTKSHIGSKINGYGFLLVLALILSPNKVLAEDCIKEFNNNTSIYGAGKLADINSDDELKKAKWALDFLNRCESNIDSMWVDRVKTDKNTIEENIQKYESTQKDLKAIRDRCKNFDACAEKISAPVYKNWYSNELSVLKKLDEKILKSDSATELGGEYNVRAANHFATECSCLISELDLTGHASFAAELLKKWDREIATEKVKKLEEEKKALIAATKKVQLTQKAKVPVEPKVAAAPSMNQAQLKSIYVKLLGGNNFTSFCRLSAAFFRPNLEMPRLDGRNYWRCMDLVQNGKGRFGEKGMWEKLFEIELTNATSEEGYPKSEVSIRRLFQVGLEKSLCEMTVEKKQTEQRVSQTIGDGQRQNLRQLNSINETVEHYSSWYGDLGGSKITPGGCKKYLEEE